VQVTFRENGSIGVLVSGVSIVDGAEVASLEIRNFGGAFEIGLEGNPRALGDMSGEVGGLLQLLNADLPGMRAELDDLAQALVTEVNALHTTGTNAAGATGVDFFDPAGMTAGSINLSAAILADPQAIAVGTSDAAGNYRAGANDVALALGSLRDLDVASLGTTFGDHFRQLVSNVGLAVRSTADQATVHRTLADQADTRRSSFSGVSTDEEMVKLIQFQAAYAAAARVITVTDEILQTLLSI
jgi:flagellar hook-associated protein 1 FlgK